MRVRKKSGAGAEETAAREQKKSGAGPRRLPRGSGRRAGLGPRRLPRGSGRRAGLGLERLPCGSGISCAEHTFGELPRLLHDNALRDFFVQGAAHWGYETGQ